MTPQDKADYKIVWMRKPHYESLIHSDHRSKAEQWCKLSIPSEKVKYERWSGVYEDTVHFQTECDFNRFNKWYFQLQYAEEHHSIR